ncbi:MAG: transcription-repair coupling factor, partial [Chloroflexota bacterium]
MNLSVLLALFDELPAYRQVAADLEARRETPPLGLAASARPPLVAKLAQVRPVPTLLITGRVDNAANWLQALEAWLPAGHDLLRFPEPTPLPYERGPWSARCRLGRLTALARLMAAQHPITPDQTRPPLIVTSARAFLQKTLPRHRYTAATRSLRVGQVINLEKLLAEWTAIGYEPASVVEAPGQFSRRGGIVDIFPAAHPHPIRIELFGEEVDTLRYFDSASQRSLETPNGDLRQVLIPPGREAQPGLMVALGSYLEAVAPAKESDLPAWQDDIPALLAGAASSNLEYYLPLLHSQPASLLDYLPPEAQVIVDDWVEWETAVRELHHQAAQLAAEQPSLPPDYSGPLFDWDTLGEALQARPPLILGEREATSEASLLTMTDLGESFQPGPRFGGQVQPFLNHLQQARRDGERVVVVSSQSHRLAELWQERSRGAAEQGSLGGDEDSPLLPRSPAPAPSLETLTALPPAGSVTFVHGGLAEGFVLERPPGLAGPGSPTLLHLLTDAEIFGWNRPAPRRRRPPRAIAPEARYADVNPGDYIVHVEYGIGRFEGLVSRSVGGMEREYLQVSYANSDVLYVPAHHADRLSRWVGPDDRPPSLHRLGEKTWSKAKAKAQQVVDELAGELLDLYAARETVAGHAFGRDGEWQAELEASFPYQETEDQLRAIVEVKADMERPLPMDRLVCGDVGYGKTEVALRAAFKAVIDGKQVAILVPTTVLAQQHFNTFSQRLKPFPIVVEMLSRFRTLHRQEQIIKALKEGQVDIIIGTHRLLSDDVSFKDLGLVIIDEEQRFGVANKETLKQLRTEVDVLTMTATPIPRTLYMSLTGVRDVSIIETAPAERLPVETYVGEVDDKRLRQAILRELDRGGQVFYVHNRVQTIETVLAKLRRLLPEATIAVGHGQMSERELEQVMLSFVDGKVDVLLSTTIIESGLDIPNANTLIVDRAEQFGLAQLYQLRGRVGRGARRAYAYFFHSPWRHLSADAQARLETIAQETHLGAGYTIAMRDLEIRGAGDLLGTRQSGQIASVGFDLYTRLLARAVKRLRAERRGEPLPLETPEVTLIDVPLAAYVPPDYVPDATLRLR